MRTFHMGIETNPVRLYLDEATAWCRVGIDLPGMLREQNFQSMVEISTEPGYVYILQNDAHDSYILKIGLTRGLPEVRAKQLYWGASGVPEHFDIVVTYSVGNCVEAERRIHEKLETFRINRNREFFKIDPRVAQIVVVETCQEINFSLGLESPVEHRFTSKNGRNYIKPVPAMCDSESCIPVTNFADIFKAERAPIGTSALSSSQINRIRIVSLILTDVLKIPQGEFLEIFTRDNYPGREIVVWENIAKVYQQFDSETVRSEQDRQSAYRLILAASMVTGKDLEDAIANCGLSYEAMLSIVNAMRP